MANFVAPLLNFASTAAVALVAATASYAVGRGAKRQEWELNIRREKIAVRERLYASFLAEANRQILLSLEQKSSDPLAFHDITAKLSEIELLSHESVCVAARAICDRVIDSHAIEPKSEANFYALKSAFIEAAREEFASLER